VNEDVVFSVSYELAQAVRTLKNSVGDSATTDARKLMALTLGIEPSRMTLHLHDELNLERYEDFWILIRRRVDREPMSHILGGRSFYGRWFHVNNKVLDPRPETETLIAEALSKPFSEVLDLGTGSGAIAVTLLDERPTATGIATDLSPGALEVATANAETHGVLSRLNIEVSDWYAAVGGTFDLIVSNPPYIALDEMPSLAPELSYEPRMALTDEADGLTAYRKIVAGAPEHLNADGWIMVEIGWQQGPEVAALFEDAGLTNVAIKPDLDGRDRVVIGQKA